MFRSEPMQKVRIIALASARYDLVKNLHKLGVMDVRKSNLNLSDDTAPVHLTQISDYLVKFKSALSVLKEPAVLPKKAYLEEIEYLEDILKKAEKLTRLTDEIFKLSDESKITNENISAYDEAIGIAKNFEGMDIDFSKLQSNVLEFRAFLLGNREAAMLKTLINRHKIESEILENRLDRKRRVLFIAFAKTSALKFEEQIRSVRYEEINLTNRLLDSKPDDVIKKLQKMKTGVSDRSDQIDKKLTAISDENYFDILTLTELLEIEYERATINANFKKTDKTFIVEGWIPRKSLDELTETVKLATKDRFHIEEIYDDELAPTLLTRPRFLHPFDYLVEFYSVPRSDEIDPTWIFITSFAVLYGLMVSDIGYGIVSLIFSLYLIRRTDPDGLLHNVAMIWALCSFSIIFFGLITNQLFGFSLPQLNRFKVFDWTKDIQTVILATIVIGIIEVVSGQALGFLNRMKHGERKLAVAKVLSIVGILAGVVAVGGGLFHAVDSTSTLVATGVTIIAFGITAALSGLEAIELLSLATHILSFTRLLGFGLASVIIASIIDKSFLPMPSQGIVVFIFTLLIFIVLHMINMVLGIFEGLVQSVRLNFVEFFSKFYMGNGVKFRPYQVKKHYTKD